MLNEESILEFMELNVDKESFEDVEEYVISTTPSVKDGNVEYLKYIIFFVHSRINEELGDESFIYSSSKFNIIAALSNEFRRNEFLDVINGTYKSGYIGKCPIYVTPKLIDEVYAVNKDTSKILKFKIVK